MAMLQAKASKDPSASLWVESNWWSAAMLASYAAAFSFAYVSLSSGTGPAFVRCRAGNDDWVGLRHGERLIRRQVLALFLAVGGIIWLLAPGARMPKPWGAP